MCMGNGIGNFGQGGQKGLSEEVLIIREQVM